MSGGVTCASCGNEVASGDKFCASCGTPVALGEETVLATSGHEVGTNPTQCVKCGASMGRDDRFCPQCGSSRPEPATVVSHVSLRNAQASRLIDATQGEFEIVQQLGTGAMGAVYLARDVSLGREVAIKVIAPHLLSDDTMVSRFRLEAQTVASLRHPNIVNVHAVRQKEDLHYFVMQFIDGPPLRSVVKGHAPLDVDVVQAILFQVGSALSHAHRSGRGVIHRDVKPANIMIDREGDAFVTDFGISKIAEVQSGLTQTGATIGTPEYMSPEQCRGETLTGASDQYALGIVAYEMLCGHTPFSGSQYHIMVAHTTEEPKPIRELRPDCPEHVAATVERMLAKSPLDRWPDLDAAVMAMGGALLGYRDPIRSKIKALAGATQVNVPAVSTGSRSGASGGQATLDTATSVTVTGLPSILEIGERIQLRADVRGAGNESLSGLGLTWASTDPSIARVEGSFVEGLRPGTVSIMASAGNVASSVLLQVAEPAPASVVVRPSSVRMQAGGRIALSAQVQDRRGRDLEREIRWLSSDAGVATVSATGEVVATGSGPVTITAESESVRATAEIHVEAAPAVTPEVTPEAVSAPADVSAPGPPPSEPRAATVAPPVEADAPSGPARSAGKSAARPRGPAAPARKPRRAPASSAPPTRRPLRQRPAAVAAALVLVVGASVVGLRSLTAGREEGTPTPGSPALGSSGEGAFPASGSPSAAAPLGTPSTPGAAGASGQAGSGRGAAGGSAGATGGGAPAAAPPEEDPPAVASSPSESRPPLSASAPATSAPTSTQPPAPSQPPPAPSRVSVTLPASTMQVGGTQSASASVLSAGGSPMSRGSYTLAWRSSNGDVVAANPQTGALRAAGPGSAWIVATAGNARDSALVTVAAAVSAVAIAESDLTLEVGSSSRSLTAAVRDGGGRPVERAVTWSSSDASVATVDAGGAVTPVGVGSARITASAEGFSDQVTVSVTAPAPTLPSGEEVRAAVGEYVAALSRGDRDTVARLWGSADEGARDELVELMGENSFDATLGTVEAPSLAGGAAEVTFQVEARWRTNFGQNRNRLLNFRARLERAGSGWQVASSSVP